MNYIKEASKFMYDDNYVAEGSTSIEDSVKGILDKQYMIKKLDKIEVNKQHKTVEITFKPGYLKTVSMPPNFEMGWKRHFKEEGYELKMAEVFEKDDMIVLDFASI